jgi:hypothetical protein
MASFVVGTIPLPLLLHTQIARVQLRWAQEVLAFTAAALLIWRAALPLHASCH